MSDTIVTDRPFVTNGVTIPAGKISTDDIKELMHGPRGGVLTDEQAKEVQADLLDRQKRYNAYTVGIHERHEIMHDSGSMAMGGGAE